MDTFIFYILIFILGLAVGSFLNVVIFRLENGEKIVNDRSKCLCCKHILAWYDLIPIFSFIFLKGKCRYCNKKISWQYPAVEIITGILFVVILSFLSKTSPCHLLAKEGICLILFWWFIASTLIVIFVYDLKHYIIPDKIIYPAIVVTFIYRLFEVWNFSAQGGPASGWQFLNFLFAAFIAGLFFYIIVIVTKGKGMGGGDVKLGFLMGLILGWPLVLIALFLSFILGSIIGIFLILVGRKKMKSMIPFGPFLVLGTFIALFWGEGIMGWYFNSILS